MSDIEHHDFLEQLESVALRSPVKNESSEKQPDINAHISQLPINTVEHIFRNFLGPQDLARARSVCKTWSDVTYVAPWQRYYQTLWPQQPPSPCNDSKDWQTSFSTRMLQARSLRGRAEQDRLINHTAGVKCCKILPFAGQNGSDLLLTGSVDRTLRVWDLNLGVQLAQSQLHAGTVRCLAYDDNLLATGSSDHRIRLWSPFLIDQQESEQPEDAGTRSVNEQPVRSSQNKVFSYDIAGPRQVLPGGHTGPVASMQLTDAALISGSWDYTLKVWDRTADFECIQTLAFEDWVQGMSLRANRVLVASGQEAWVFDAGKGGLIPLHAEKHAASFPTRVTAVEGTEDGKSLFYSTADGMILACDLRCIGNNSKASKSTFSSGGSNNTLRFCTTASSSSSSTNAVMNNNIVALECSSAVMTLSWEFPWLGASLADGEVLLLNSERALGFGEPAAVLSSSSSSMHHQQRQKQRQKKPWPAKVLAGGVPGGAQCVDIAGTRVVAGYEGGAVVSWDFSKALEAGRRADAMRSARKQARKNRQQRAAMKQQRAGL